MKEMVKLIEMYLNKTCNKVRIATHLPNAFPIQNEMKQECALFPTELRCKEGSRNKEWLNCMLRISFC